MTLGEFKAWLDGFEMSFGQRQFDIVEEKFELPHPDGDQWRLIKAKLDKVGVPVAPPVQLTDMRSGLKYPAPDWPCGATGKTPDNWTTCNNG